jgi:hypothetical protein
MQETPEEVEKRRQEGCGLLFLVLLEIVAILYITFKM